MTAVASRRSVSVAPVASNKEIKIGGETTVTCVPKPPVPGQLISDGSPGVLKNFVFAPKATQAPGGSAKTVSVSMTDNFGADVKECATAGKPFHSVVSKWEVEVSDAQGLAAQQTATIRAECPDGGDSCLEVPLQQQVKCGNQLCECGQVCCSEVPDPESRCTFHALCNKLKMINDSKNRKKNKIE